jgi:hypothetical protein
MKTKIEQVFRAVVWAEASLDPAHHKKNAKSADISYEASQRMSKLELRIRILLAEHDVTFDSENTQVLWHGAFAVESSDRKKVEQVVTLIEALIAKTKHVSLIETEDEDEAAAA